MKNKKSVLVLIALSFWLIYAVFSLVSYSVNTGAYYGKILESRKSVVNLQFDYATHFLMNQKPLALVPRLQHGINSHQYDFFLLKQKDKVLGYYVNTGKLEDINQDFKTTDGFFESQNKFHKTIEIFDYKLTIGFNFGIQSLLAFEIGNQKISLIVDLALVTFLVFLIVYFILKDILQISKLMGSKDRKQIQKIQSLSKEAEALILATGGYEELSENLRTDKLLLASSLGPAINEELRSGRKAPYSFTCTLARVDLNGYTQLVLQKKPDELIHLLSDYFRKSRDLIERYHGLIYQYVGDEIIFLFKSENSDVSARQALASIRGLFEMAENLKSPGLPNGVRLKASLVSGSLQFVKMDQGHSFNGLPLIESVRMLGQVTEKTENTLIIYAESLGALSPLCEVSSTKTTVFKGFENESSLLEVRKFTSCSDAIDRLPPEMLGQYFRSPQDLVTILTKLNLWLRDQNETAFFQSIANLREMHLQAHDVQTLPELSDQYRNLLHYCLEHKLDHQKESRILASVISLSQNIFADSPDPEIIKLLEICEKAQDSRVRANVIVALSYFGIQVQDLHGKFNSTSNRLAADALFIAGQNDFTQALADKVSEFIRSEDPRFIASGLYLIASLIDFHGQRDLVYLKTNTSLRSLAKEVPRFVQHPEAMVRNRALKSLEIIQRGGFFEN